MALSIFEDQSTQSTQVMIEHTLGERYADWQKIIGFVKQHHKAAEEVWNYMKSYGWSLRVKDAKRVLVYLTPGDKKFIVSLVFGRKATEEAFASDLYKTDQYN